MQDLKLSMVQYLDIDDVINLCETDKSMYYGICKTRAFWRPFFEKENIALPSDNINTTQGWINHYHTMRKILYTIDDIIFQLRRNSIFVELQPKYLPLQPFIDLGLQLGLLSAPYNDTNVAHFSLAFITISKKKHVYNVFFSTKNLGHYILVATEKQLRAYLNAVFKTYTYDISSMALK